MGGGESVGRRGRRYFPSGLRFRSRRNRISLVFRTKKKSRFRLRNGSASFNRGPAAAAAVARHRPYPCKISKVSCSSIPLAHYNDLFCFPQKLPPARAPSPAPPPATIPLPARDFPAFVSRQNQTE